ncbi:SDR family oxidoreductase [Gordonia sp. CPCC 205515]|uniref:SDR family NAD(P)-dependent oxidoreductase n=1 Tax=Gordonia sp. CPCC 205515 TaxID=3140791 RepID=UPI003AF3B674
MKDFRDKVVVITGAGSGMGRDLAVKIGRMGAKLAISDLNPDGLALTEKLVAETGAPVHAQILNVAEREAVLAYAETVVAHYGTVNVIFNNAGIAHHGDIEHMEFKDIERVMDVDYWGVVNGTKAFLPHIIASGDGHIVNTSSLFGLLAEPGQAAYNSAKFAVRGFTEALNQEMIVAKHPVKVTCVHPGGIKTAIARNATASGDNDQQKSAEFFDRYLARMSSEDAADVIIGGVRKNRARVLVGTDAKLLDLWVRIVASGYQGIVARVTGWALSKAR